MNETMPKYIKGSIMFATSKPRNKHFVLYTPLLVPSHPWETIPINIVGGLSMSKMSHDYLYVVVDRFNKMCILMLAKKQIIVESTTNMFFANVWVHFGLPTCIKSD
jgi:hypothetical protein